MNTAVTTSDTCFYSQSADNLKWLWHKRLSHLNFKDIHKLASRGLVSSLPSMTYVKDRICPGCEIGKHHHASFKSKQVSSVEKSLHLLHMDLFGPVSTPSMGGKKYTLVIVDEFTRYTWVFFLKYKSEAADEIINFVK